jgi:hypothetical protein
MNFKIFKFTLFDFKIEISYLRSKFFLSILFFIIREAFPISDIDLNYFPIYRSLKFCFILIEFRYFISFNEGYFTNKLRSIYFYK